jgi:hypothetical protein
MPTYFISGHLDLTQQEFNAYYRELLVRAIDAGGTFVVGDARGADTMTQEFFKGDKDVTVYHMFDKPRNNVYDCKTVGGFKSDDERDTAMTAASNEDIAWVRPGREKSGTAKNLERRKKQHET